MKIFKLKTVQTLPITIEEAWGFFSSPNNLSKITPSSMDFRILTELPKKIYPGMIVQYTVKPMAPFRISWLTEITQVREPNFFVDEQRFGPYGFWHHQHHFKKVAQGTAVIDLVHYGLPLGFLGRIAHGLFVKQKLNAIFEYRESALIQLFGDSIKTETLKA